ncbi:hypothetical protein [Amycolatopsis sp. cmx-4-83]|uniref:hypothetical protein n=1 Tax=Amycolatopsis sp. cmx-4-83 TaxID=2790940 RepID=UPI00397805A3
MRAAEDSGEVLEIFLPEDLQPAPAEVDAVRAGPARPRSQGRPPERSRTGPLAQTSGRGPATREARDFDPGRFAVSPR